MKTLFTIVIFFGLTRIISAQGIVRITPLGNVGIGVDPHAPLQFNNDVVNRKIVLYENANNDHEFYGFGINGSTLRYQVSNTLDNHIFYSGSSGSNSNELMRIQGNGNVGIGTTTPPYKLSITDKFGIDENGSAHFFNVPRQHYFYEDALLNKMILSHSPTYPTWGLQYTFDNKFRFLADSNQVMSVDLGANKVEVNGSLDVGGSLDVSGSLDVGGSLEVDGSVKIGHLINQNGPLYIGPNSSSWLQCGCPPGTVVLGGGFYANSSDVRAVRSFPDSPTTWRVDAYNADIFNSEPLWAFAVCARIAN